MNVSVFCGATLPHNDFYTRAAEQLGTLLAQQGHTLLYGGSNLGLMGVVSGAALAHGGTVVGVIPTFFSEEIILSQPVTQLVRVASLAERKAYLLAHSDAFIALPGGIGTLDEVTEVMVANQLQQLDKPMLLLNLDGYYDPFLQQLERCKSEGLMRSSGCLINLNGASWADELTEVIGKIGLNRINGLDGQNDPPRP